MIKIGIKHTLKWLLKFETETYVVNIKVSWQEKTWPGHLYILQQLFSVSTCLGVKGNDQVAWCRAIYIQTTRTSATTLCKSGYCLNWEWTWGCTCIIQINILCSELTLPIIITEINAIPSIVLWCNSYKENQLLSMEYCPLVKLTYTQSPIPQTIQP